MNFRLQVFFIFLSIVSSYASDPMEERRRADFLSVINNLRRDVANRFKIPYMHELVCGDSVRKIREQLFQVFDHTLYQQYDISFKDFACSFKFRSYDKLRLESLFIDSIISSRNKTYYEIGVTENSFQFLSPQQKRIRCSKLKDGGLKCVLGPM